MIMLRGVVRVNCGCFLFCLFVISFPFVSASLNESLNESLEVNITAEFNESTNDSLQENFTDDFLEDFNDSVNGSFEVNESFNESTVEMNIFEFVVESFVEGGDYSFDLFEFLLGSYLMQGDEYGGTGFVDTQETPNAVGEGATYSATVGYYGISAEPVSTYCGDGVCDSDENCSTCPEDCGECEGTSSGGTSLGGSTGDCIEGYEMVDGICVEMEEEILIGPGVEKERFSNDSDVDNEFGGGDDFDEDVTKITGNVIGDFFEEGGGYYILFFVFVFLIFVLLRYSYLKGHHSKKKVKKKKASKKKKKISEYSNEEFVEKIYDILDR